MQSHLPQELAACHLGPLSLLGLTDLLEELEELGATPAAVAAAGLLGILQMEEQGGMVLQAAVLQEARPPLTLKDLAEAAGGAEAAAQRTLVLAVVALAYLVIFGALHTLHPKLALAGPRGVAATAG